MFATGNSQLEFTEAHRVDLRSEIPWHRVVVFHMDEYVGIDPGHDAGFAKWIRERIVDKVKPHRGAPDRRDATTRSPNASVTRSYSRSTRSICAASGSERTGTSRSTIRRMRDLDDPASVKVVTLEESCRLQQVNEGHFPDIEAVPGAGDHGDSASASPRRSM